MLVYRRVIIGIIFCNDWMLYDVMYGSYAIMGYNVILFMIMQDYASRI